jgi:hypothetical protein
MSIKTEIPACAGMTPRVRPAQAGISFVLSPIKPEAGLIGD